MSANSAGEMDYRCLKFTCEWLSDGSFNDTEAGKKKWCYLACSKIQKMRRCQRSGVNTDCSKMFFGLFPLDKWKCCLGSFGTLGALEMMSLQMLYDRVLACEPQCLDWTVWDGNFCVAHGTV